LVLESNSTFPTESQTGTVISFPFLAKAQIQKSIKGVAEVAVKYAPEE